MRFIRWIVNFIKKAINDNIMVYAAQAAYYLVVSSIPMIIILLSAGVYFLPLDKGDIIKVIPKIVSEDLQALALEIVNEFFARPKTSIISVSAITTLWSASRGIAAVERGVRAVYEIPKRKHYIVGVLFSFVYTLLLVAVFLLSIGVVGFGEIIVSFINKYVGRFAIDINLFLYLLIFALTVFIFTAMYAGFSTGKIPFRYHLPGGIFTGAGWILFSYVFSVYINNFANYSRIYGSLTAIVLLMLWVYCAMIILLFGAEINLEIIKGKSVVRKEK